MAFLLALLQRFMCSIQCSRCMQGISPGQTATPMSVHLSLEDQCSCLSWTHFMVDLLTFLASHVCGPKYVSDTLGLWTASSTCVWGYAFTDAHEGFTWCMIWQRLLYDLSQHITQLNGNNVCIKHAPAVLQDIDVAYATDPAIFDDFDADLSSLLEVPDLDFPSSQDFPQASYRDSAFASSSANAGLLFNPCMTQCCTFCCHATDVVWSGCVGQNKSTWLHLHRDNSSLHRDGWARTFSNLLICITVAQRGSLHKFASVCTCGPAHAMAMLQNRMLKYFDRGLSGFVKSVMMLPDSFWCVGLVTLWPYWSCSHSIVYAVDSLHIMHMWSIFTCFWFVTLHSRSRR